MGYQTVFYDKSNLEILSVKKNHTITSRAELKSCVGHSRPDDISFLYYDNDFPAITTKMRLIKYAKSGPPVVVDDQMEPIIIQKWRRNFNLIAKNNKSINCYFEGGMGDLLMQAAAINAAKIQYPNINFVSYIKKEYEQIAALIYDFQYKTFDGIISKKIKNDNNILFDPTMISDPRKEMYGKASLYGIFLGLEKVSYETHLDLSKLNRSVCYQLYHKLNIDKKYRTIILHAFSASGDDKSMPANLINFIVKNNIKDENDKVVFVGRKGQFPPNVNYDFNLCGKVSWMETLWLLIKANKIFCVDSAIMHICYCAGIRCERYWGTTTPQMILGDPWTGLDHNFELNNNCDEGYTKSYKF